ncbi:lamin tail domain-containing protein, partial [candidate division KSB1 bacterium]|nr:lamin tail domain-containing protein [candidate division KSB1 bacterium]
NEMPNHIERWRDYCGNNVCGIPSMDQWENAVSSMRSIVQSRPATVQNQLMNLFHFDSMVQLDIQVQQPDYGNVKLGQQTIITDTYSGQFFRDMTVLLNAEANKGFQFAGWRQTSESTTILLNTGAVWKYFDDGSSPGTGWNEIDFNDSAWPSGPAQLGYGDDDENTVVDFGPDSNQKYTTTYFRTTFHMTDISHVRSLTFKLLRDDGAVVYLNGNEVLRANMPGGSIQYDTPAAASVGGSDEDTFFEYTVDTNALLNGKNTVAVEVHQYNGSSSDISFDLEIEALTTGNSDDVISENPELIINLSENQALTALFSLDFENELPVQINQDIILTAANSPYIALQDIVVLPNVTLSMSQGAEIQFSEGASFVINGRLVANGTADEPVIFEGIGNSRWGALCFENTTGPSLLSHVHIRGATTGEDAVRFKAAVSSWNSDITLDYIEMTKVNQPLYGNGGTILLTRSTLDGTDSGDDIANIQYASARVENCHLIGNGELDFDSVDDGIIRNNRIDIISTNSNRDGIDIGASDRVLIENNRIFDCPDKGISVGEGSEGTVIIGNLIVNTSMGVAVKDGSYAKIDHNTFFNDSVGVACYEKVAGQGGGNATVTNSIFSGSYNAEYSLDPKSTIEITYSLSEKNQIQGTGNLSGAAYFINALSGNFYLTPDSPCIDTGDPSAPTDPDGSRTDIGSYFYNKGPIKTTYLVINEFMADNTKTLADEAGQFDDWIEIYNGSDEPINVAGLYLTDDFSHPTLWRIPDYAPELTTIAAGGYLLVWADKDLDQGFLHADLKLSASGEQLALVKKSEDQIFFVDSLAYSTQRADVSRGRFNDGAVKWIDFAVPTPGQANDSARIDNSQNENEIPAKFAVFQNFPNPFNPSTTIGYDLPIAAYVKIEVFNSLGQRISVLKQEHKEAGAHRVEWRGMDDAGHQVSSGIYFYKVTAEEFSAVGKMVLMK